MTTVTAQALQKLRQNSCEWTPEEESLEATSVNSHRGCGRDKLGQTVPTSKYGQQPRGRPHHRRWTAVYDRRNVLRQPLSILVASIRPTYCGRSPHLFHRLLDAGCRDPNQTAWPPNDCRLDSWYSSVCRDISTDYDVGIPGPVWPHTQPHAPVLVKASKLSIESIFESSFELLIDKTVHYLGLIQLLQIGLGLELILY